MSALIQEGDDLCRCSRRGEPLWLSDPTSRLNGQAHPVDVDNNMLLFLVDVMRANRRCMDGLQAAVNDVSRWEVW